MISFSQEEVRAVGPEDVAALFVVYAAITPTDAGQLLAWTQGFEEWLESGGRAWAVGRGRRLVGYAIVDPVPGLPGVFDLEGGIVPARRRQGLGTMLLRHLQREAGKANVRQLSCRVAGLEDETAQFLLKRDFHVEHEECLLELADLNGLPPLPDRLPIELRAFPQVQAVSEFDRIYEESFSGMPWSQPYTEAEVAAALARPEDLLFAVAEDVWCGTSCCLTVAAALSQSVLPAGIRAREWDAVFCWRRYTICASVARTRLRSECGDKMLLP